MGLFHIDLKESSYNVANNTSQVSMKVYLDYNGASYNHAKCPLNITIGGSYSKLSISNKISKSVSFDIRSGSDTLYSTSFTVYHNGDGSANLNVSANFNGDTGDVPYVEATKNLTLTKIPRASTFNMPSTVTIGDKVTINIKKANNSYTSTLWYKIWHNGAWHSQEANPIATKTNSSQVVWDLTGANAKRLHEEAHNYGISEMVMTLDTYNGVTKMGSTTFSFQMNSILNNASFSQASVGSTVSVDISKKSTNTESKVLYTFGSLNGTVTEKTKESRVRWTIPSNFSNEMTSVVSKTGTLKTETYSAGVLVGTNTSNFTIVVDKDNSKPVVLLDIYDVNPVTTALTHDNHLFIKYETNAKYTITATAKNGATISSYECVNGMNPWDGQTGTIPSVVSPTFIGRATDSRGYSNEDIITRVMVDYVKPTCAIRTISTAASGRTELTIGGDYFNNTFGSGGAANSITVQFRYRENGGSYGSWYNISSRNISFSGNSYSANGTVTVPDYTRAYEFEARVSDKINKNVLSSHEKVKAFPVFDWGANDFHFAVPVTMDKPLGISEGGTGATSLDGLISNLPLGAVASKDIVPVSMGGTGATSASSARSNLGISKYLQYAYKSGTKVALQWSDGSMIYGEKKTLSGLKFSAWGQSVSSNLIGLGSYPSSYTFSSTPAVSIVTTGTNGMWVNSVINSSGSYIGDAYFSRPTGTTSGGTSYNGEVVIIAVGRWK